MPSMPQSGANVTLELSGVTPEQFKAHQAEYNHLIAQARGSLPDVLCGC